ncbi:MAG: fructose-6-phosphate aldolase, partial [Candidatus Kerfeldbacteria bacterium CG_4_10_14_0_8_um_filter_42_10]
TANLSEIREAASMGLLDGVTTNPSLVAKEQGVNFYDLLRKICEIVNGPVSAEVVSLDSNGMLKEAEVLAKIHQNITIKCPMTTEGLKACRELSGKGIKTNMTLVFSPSQAILAAKAGATFVSPFVGRLDDCSSNGMELIKQIVAIYRNYQFKTEVLVASVRHSMHVVESALIGAHVVTMPFNVIAQLAKHPLTDSGIEKFLKDWENVLK